MVRTIYMSELCLEVISWLHDGMWWLQEFYLNTSECCAGLTNRYLIKRWRCNAVSAFCISIHRMKFDGGASLYKNSHTKQFGRSVKPRHTVLIHHEESGCACNGSKVSKLLLTLIVTSIMTWLVHRSCILHHDKSRILRTLCVSSAMQSIRA